MLRKQYCECLYEQKRQTLQLIELVTFHATIDKARELCSFHPKCHAVRQAM